MSQADDVGEADDVTEFVNEHTELLSRILACGNDEARAYALALLANSDDSEGVEAVDTELDRIRSEVES